MGPRTVEKSVHKDAAWERVRRYLAQKGLRSTGQRDLIIETFFSAGGHINAEELTRAVKRRNRGVGAATVYRTLRLLSDCGVAVARTFGDGEKRYEVEDHDGHHDHLICESCGTIIEFEDDEIEALQDAVAKRYGFKLSRHKHELYGLCRSCAS